ncbi:uncharacterized protein LOC117185702 isoform X1 [Drosophila miranda]|uniref:uncharacterized protein LOC117185702 isoform X1 n=1 Tax=Drosophila miranda TaxID=7229 RepID=UPI0007E72E0D|nr:uncharacterized protein LOC117185702 isoform X1 [Drosophila miranda]
MLKYGYVWQLVVVVVLLQVEGLRGEGPPSLSVRHPPVSNILICMPIFQTKSGATAASIPRRSAARRPSTPTCTSTSRIPCPTASAASIAASATWGTRATIERVPRHGPHSCSVSWPSRRWGST